MTAGPGRVVAAFPFYPDNPWQDLVYRGLVARGDRAVGVREFFDVNDLRSQLDGALPDALHLGWSTPLTQTVPDVAESMRRVVRFVDVVARLREQGVRVVWTVHNVMSHELHHVTPELALHRRLAAEVDVVHVMNPRTAEVVQPLYRLPTGSLRHVPHPSYPVDVRVRSAPRDEADPVRLLFFGEIRPYKGVVAFAELVHRARSTGASVELDVRGRVGGGLTEDELRGSLGALDGVSFTPGRVPDAEVAMLLARADAIVLPYAGGLNSGVAVLASSSGSPLVVGAALRPTWPLEPAWQLPLWDTDSDAAAETGSDDEIGLLVRAVERLRHDGAELSRQAARRASETAPDALADEYAELFLPTRP